MKTIKIKDYAEIPNKFTGKAEHEDGSINFLLNRKYHRLDGPAYAALDGYKAYWINDKFICSSDDKDYEQIFYNSKEYKLAKQQEDLLNNFKLIKNIKDCF